MKAICTACTNECDAKIRDEGIGQYEYWGYVGYDKQLVVLSDCCNALCMDEQGKEIMPHDIKDHEECLKAENSIYKDA